MNGPRLRMLLVFAASMVVILVFSSMNVYTLFFTSLGGGIMLLAFFSYYRVAAVFGLLLVAISAGASSEVTTLTEAGQLFTAVVGLIIPVVGLTLFALSSEFEGDHRFRQRRPFVVSGTFAALCLAVVPSMILLVGALTPSLTSRVEGFIEMAFVLLVASVGATVLTIREVRLK